MKNSAAVVVESGREKDRRHALMRPLMLVTTFFWASNIIAGKVALRSISPLALAQFRVTVTAAIFGILFLAWRRWVALRLTAEEWGFLALTSIFGITLNQIFFMGAIGRTSAAHAGLIVALGPVIVLILASAMGLEVFTLLKVIGTLLAFSGVAVLALGKRVSPAGSSVMGDAIMLGGTTVFAYYTVLLKRAASRYDTLTLNALTFCLGALFMVPFSLPAVVKVKWHLLPLQAWCGMLFIVLLGTVISYLIYALALTELTATQVAVFAYLQPIVTIVLAVWLLAERITLAIVLGGLLILAGVYLAEREPGEEKVQAGG